MQMWTLTQIKSLTHSLIANYRPRHPNQWPFSARFQTHSSTHTHTNWEIIRRGAVCHQVQGFVIQDWSWLECIWPWIALFESSKKGQHFCTFDTTAVRDCGHAENWGIYTDMMFDVRACETVISLHSVCHCYTPSNPQCSIKALKSRRTARGPHSHKYYMTGREASVCKCKSARRCLCFHHCFFKCPRASMWKMSLHSDIFSPLFHTPAVLPLSLRACFKPIPTSLRTWVIYLIHLFILMDVPWTTPFRGIAMHTIWNTSILTNSLEAVHTSPLYT